MLSKAQFERLVEALDASESMIKDMDDEIYVKEVGDDRFEDLWTDFMDSCWARLDEMTA